MEIEQNPQLEGDRPQWLGSVAKRLDTSEAQALNPPELLAETPAPWTGSPVRAAIFEVPAIVPAPIPLPVPSTQTLQAPIAQGRVVMGELGMTLRVAA